MHFGRSSLLHLATCDQRLRKVADRAIGWGIYDFSVTEGYRSPEAQFQAFQAGRSKLDGYQNLSKHNRQPALAMDLVPWPAVVNGRNIWEDPQRFHVLAGIILAAAKVEGVALRWGGDWDGDGNNADATLHDLPHFELVSDV